MHFAKGTCLKRGVIADASEIMMQLLSAFRIDKKVFIWLFSSKKATKIWAFV